MAEIRDEVKLSYKDLDSRFIHLGAVPKNTSVTLRGQKILKPLFEPIKWVRPAKKKGKSKNITHKYNHIKQNIIIADNFIEQSELK